MSESEHTASASGQASDTDTDGDEQRALDPGSVGDSATLHVDNLGGIEELEFEFTPGISLLAGENATNRTSLLRSLAAALGGNDSAASLKTDAADGSVELTIGDAQYTRTYAETATEYTLGGEPYCDQPELVDTFVALFADNPARHAVAQGEELRELLMRPVDTDAIRREIRRKQDQKSDLESDIERIERRERELPALEEDRQRLLGELEELEVEIEEVQARANDLEPAEEESQEVAELRETLEDRRGDLRDLEDELDTIERKIDFRKQEQSELRSEREEIEEELGEFTDVDQLDGEIDRLSTEINRLESQRRNLQTAIEDLQTVVEVNETISQGNLDVPGLEASDDLTAALDPSSQQVECWTCGTEVERDRITERIETLRGLIQDQREEVTAIDQRLEELRDERSDYQSKRDTYADLQARREEIADRFEMHEEQLVTLEADRDDLQKDIADLEADIADVEAELSQLETEEEDEPSEFVETHQRLTELERERGRVESKLEQITDEIEEIESLREERERKEQELSALSDDLEQLRGQIDRLETQLVETVNEMLEDLVEKLEYRNIARVWVERKTSADHGEESMFDLHIVREGEDGAVYEDTVDTLSESEREIIGLVVALAGYLVHDIDEKIPFLLIDSVEMIDAQRLADLLRYITDRSDVEFLVTALLLKDAAAVEETEVLSDRVTTYTAEFS
jgi:DNA repair ATPase RecN